VIIISEWFFGLYLAKGNGHLSQHPLQPTPSFYWPAITALLIGYTVGIVTSGVIPGLSAFHVGIPFLFGWFSGVASYIPLRLISHRRQCQAGLGLSAVSVAGPGANEAVDAGL